MCECLVFPACLLCMNVLMMSSVSRSLVCLLMMYPACPLYLRVRMKSSAFRSMMHLSLLYQVGLERLHQIGADGKQEDLDVTVPDVLFVPGCGFNLFSVWKVSHKHELPMVLAGAWDESAGAEAGGPNDVFHIDLCGAYTATIGGNHYMLFGVDAATGWMVCYAMRRKSEALAVVKRMVVDAAHKAGTAIKCIRCDCDALWTSSAFKEFCASMGIALEYSPPGVQQYNGVVESAIQRCLKMAKASRRAAQELLGPAGFSRVRLPSVRGDELWAKSAKDAAQELNQSAPPSNPGGASPQELYTGKGGPFSLIPFFQYGFKWERPATKMDDRAVPCFFLNAGDNHADVTVNVLKERTGHVCYTSNVASAALPPSGGGGCSTSPTPSAETLPTPQHLLFETVASPPPAAAAAAFGARVVARAFTWCCRSAAPECDRVIDIRRLTAARCCCRRRTAAAAASFGARVVARAFTWCCRSAAPECDRVIDIRRLTAARCCCRRRLRGPRCGPRLRLVLPLRRSRGRPRHRYPPSHRSPLLQPPPDVAFAAAFGVCAAVAVAAAPGLVLPSLPDDAVTTPLRPTEITMGLLAQANEDVLLSMLDARRVMNGKTMLRPGLEGGGGKGGGGEQLARSEGCMGNDNCKESKLIFDWKVDAFGFPTKAKARLVARGDMQKEYIDFGDLYAPFVASSSVRMLAALACELHLELRHFDIDQAFVRAPLKEDIFMRLPEGCVGMKERCDQFGKDLGEPDIANSVRAVARFCSAPKLIHWKAALSIKGYAVRTSSLGISFQRGRISGLSLIAFVDADYVSRAANRRSVSGGVVMCAGGAIAWFSKTQKCVTLSTTQAEYVAMADMGKEMLFLRQVWRFMLPKELRPCTPLQLVDEKEVEIIHVASKDQHADFLTKALPEREFVSHWDYVMNLK
ncbi:unnamed protein product [Ectocarpus sp. CCAP 1310/34]|nr:unnamed protein product [Ectocarpus sp. CCAP 1310/34]